MAGAEADGGAIFFLRPAPGSATVAFIPRFYCDACSFHARLDAHTCLHVIVLDGLCEPDGARASQPLRE